MRFLNSAHWLVPWFILIMGLYSIIRYVRGYINNDTFMDTDRRLMSTFVGLMDLQATTGLTYFLWSWYAGIRYPTSVSLHAMIMFIAAVIPHFARIWKKADSSTRYLNGFYVMLASFLLMLVGLSLIPPK